VSQLEKLVPKQGGGLFGIGAKPNIAMISPSAYGDRGLILVGQYNPFQYIAYSGTTLQQAAEKVLSRAKLYNSIDVPFGAGTVRSQSPLDPITVDDAKYLLLRNNASGMSGMELNIAAEQLVKDLPNIQNIEVDQVNLEKNLGLDRIPGSYDPNAPRNPLEVSQSNPSCDLAFNPASTPTYLAQANQNSNVLGVSIGEVLAVHP
jgi:hypothetical protein